jgi:hypothetical protein
MSLVRMTTKQPTLRRGSLPVLESALELSHCPPSRVCIYGFVHEFMETRHPKPGLQVSRCFGMERTVTCAIGWFPNSL